METSPNAGCQQQKRHTVVGSYKGRQSSRNKEALTILRGRSSKQDAEGNRSKSDNSICSIQKQIRQGMLRHIPEDGGHRVRRDSGQCSQFNTRSGGVVLKSRLM